MTKEEKKYKPINSTILMLKIQQALLDNPNAKYFCISGYERYNDAAEVTFKKVGTLDLGESPYKWIISNIYVPISSVIEVKNIKNKEYVRIKLPDDFYGEVLVRDAISTDVKVKIQNHVLVYFLQTFLAFRNKKDIFVSFTEKNWKVISYEIKSNNLIKFSKSEYHYSPQPCSTYKITNSFKKRK